jgi:carboxyl-terminal processing protease
MKKILNVLILVFITAVSCTTKYNNMHSFETVWQTINDKHFDPSFGGLDWNDVYNRYQPKIAAVEKNEEFYFLINKMLFELNLSHMFVLAPEDLSQLAPILAAEGSIGIDVRMLDNDAVITSVKSDSPGFQAGLRPGYIIQSIDGIKIEQIADLKHINDIEYQNIDKETYKNFKVLVPPYNERNRIALITIGILKKINGPPDTVVSIMYVDENGENQEKKIVRVQRSGKEFFFNEKMRPFLIEFEAKYLDDNIGYIRFNAFLPPADRKFREAITSMYATDGLVIDIRGNPGGNNEIGQTIVKQLLKKPTLFNVFMYRDKKDEVILEPAEKAYLSPVVVLIDYLTGSSGERFAGCTQSIGRALIVGEHSPGSVGPAKIEKLANGSIFIYVYAQTLTPDGKIIEGNGVIPDIEVKLDRDALLKGKDPQLEAALQHIKNQIK